MKTLAVFVAVFLLASIIDAAPKRSPGQKPANQPNRVARKQPAQQGKRNANPFVKGPSGGKNKRQFPLFFQGGSVYPNYYIQQASPLVDFQNSFLEAAFLSGAHYTDLEKSFKKQNLTDSDGKPLPLDARASAAFELAFGDKKGDAKGASDWKARIISLEGLSNVNIVNPFLLAKDIDGKILKAEGGLPEFKAGKLGDANSSAISLISPFHGGRLDAVFGPEIAPRYEIHYSPQGITLGPLPPFAGGAGVNSAIGLTPIGAGAFGVAPYGAAGFGPVGPIPTAYGIAPSFNPFFGGYPYPFLPTFDPKSLKSNGKSNDGKKLDSTEQPTETTSESYQESTSESSPADSSSEPTSESPASEGSQSQYHYH